MSEAKAKVATPKIIAMDEILSQAVMKRSATPRTTAQTTEAPINNPVYKILISEEMSPEQKRSAVAEFMAFPGSKEESKARNKAYQEVEEYTQSVREQMAQEIIKLTDTETFSELKAVYDELNTALLDFDKKMSPLTDIVDAIYVLRTNDKVMDAFKEIQTDRQVEKERKERRDKIGSQFEEIKQNIRWLNNTIVTLGEEKTLFGFGGIKKAARQDIASKELALKDEQDKLTGLQSELSSLDANTGDPKTTLGEFAGQKEKLRELLDISSDEHKDRQRELVDSALNFVNLAKQRIGSVRQHLGKMNDQVDNLYDANARMSEVYAVLNEGIKEAEETSQKSRGELIKAPDNEGLLAKMKRDETRMAIEDHIRALDTGAANTTATYADLTSQTIRIKTMRDANQNQMDKARVMHTQGIAGVADRLSVVLQAVSSAALGESSAMARGTLESMVASTNKVAQKEAIKVAMGVQELNEDVVKAIDDLGTYGEVVRASTNITREGLTEMRENLAKLKALSESAHEDIHEAIAVHADVGAGATKQPTTLDAPGQKPNGLFGARG